MIVLGFVATVVRVLFGDTDESHRHFEPSKDDTWFVLDALEYLSTTQQPYFSIQDIAKRVKTSGHRMSLQNISGTCLHHFTRGNIARSGSHTPRYAITEKGRKLLHLK